VTSFKIFNIKNSINRKNVNTKSFYAQTINSFLYVNTLTFRKDEKGGYEGCMELFVQEMVGGHVIVTFNRIDVELTRNEAEQLKVLLAEALENITRDPLPRGQ
jgi:hypothetical protein